MRYIREYWREAVCIVLVTGLVGIIRWLIDTTDQRGVEFFFAVICTIVVLALLFSLLKSLWRLKWRRAFVVAAQSLFRYAASFFLKIAERFSQLLGIDRKTVVHGKTVVTYYGHMGGEKKKAARKAVKWKHLETPRERLGFLYRYMISRRMSEGLVAHPSDTPAELKERGSCSIEQDELFDLYIDARYDERYRVSEAQVDRLKQRLDVPDKIK